MPFCRECGKEIQDDWKSCPYCSSQIEVDNEENQVQNSERSISLFVYVAIGCIVLATVLSAMSLGHSGEINYSANGSYRVNVWFNGGDAMDASDIEIKAYVNGDGEVCKNTAYEDHHWSDCSYSLYGNWEPGDELRIETGCSYLYHDNCVVQLEIRYKGDLLSGSNKEITLYD